MVTTSLIVAIDLGKFKSVFCWYTVGDRNTRDCTVATDPGEFREILGGLNDATVVIEACSPAGWVHDLCEERNVPVLVANTNPEAWAWKNVKRKTDKDDALKLARLAAIGELATVRVPPRQLRQRKSLIGLRKRLVGERIRSQNRMRGLLVSQGRSVSRGAKTWTQAGPEALQALQAEAKPLAECGNEDLWRGELHRLRRRYEQTLGRCGGRRERVRGPGAASVPER